MALQEYTISQLVQFNLPTGFAVSQDYLDSRIQYWQMILADNVPIEDPLDPYTETDWPYEWNVLISYLITWDVYQKALLGGVIVIAAGAGDMDGAKGAVKKITTGPAEVEFHDGNKTYTDMLKAIQSGGAENPFAIILAPACPLAQQLGIKIPFCRGYDYAFALTKVTNPFNCVLQTAYTYGKIPHTASVGPVCPNPE